MTVRVFLGSTSDDLQEDCRPRATRAIQRGGQVVALETWSSDFNEVLATCRQMVEQQSSHYLGIFAYRLGYFVVDSKDSLPGKPVFNRTVTLRDTWAKIQKQQAGKKK